MLSKLVKFAKSLWNSDARTYASSSPDGFKNVHSKYPSSYLTPMNVEISYPYASSRIARAET